MKKLLLASTMFLLPSAALAQCNGVFPNNTACGNISGQSNTPRAIPLNSFPANAPGGTTGQIQYNAGSGLFGGFTASGGATINTSTGVVTLSLIASASSVTGASTTYTAAQNNTMIERSNSGSPMIDTLPGTSPGILPAGTFITIKNTDTAGILAINVGSGAGLKAQTGTTGWVYICPGQAISWYSDGTNYLSTGQPSLCVLQAAASFFAAASGTASTNHGLTSAAPLTPTQAYQLAQSILDANNKTVTFSVADGTYSSPIQMIGPIIGQGKTFAQGAIFPVVLQGDTVTPSLTHWLVSVTGNSFGAIQVIGGADVSIVGFATITSGGGNGIYMEHATAAVSLINCGNTTINCIAATRESYLQIVGAMTYAGVNQGGILQSNSWISYETTATQTLSGFPVFSSCFACSQYPGTILVDSVPTFAGATGASSTRYSVFLNGVINTGGLGANFFPGNVSGASSTGGQYN